MSGSVGEMSDGVGTASERREEYSEGRRQQRSSDKSSSLTLSTGRSESADVHYSSRTRQLLELDARSKSSSVPKSTSSGSESESSEPSAKSSSSRGYDVEPCTPIAIASLVVPSTEPIKPSKEYVNISSLFVEPQKAVFTTLGGRSNHILINESNVRLAIKVRSSNNRFFRVNPVYSFLDSGTMNELEVQRLPGGSAGIDQLLVCYVAAKEEHNDDVRTLFNSATKQQWIAITITTKA